MSGEQFALPEAVERLRETRRNGRDGRLMTISAVDPLNLTGVLTSDDRVRAAASTRIVYRDGVALAALEGDYMRPLAEIDPAAADGLASALALDPARCDRRFHRPIRTFSAAGLPRSLRRG